MIDLASFLALDATLLTLFVAALTLAVSRTASWRPWRWLSLSLLGVAGFNAGYACMTIPVPEWLLQAGPRITLLGGALHAVGHLRLIAALDRRRHDRLDLALFALIALAASLVVPPGLSHSAEIAVREVPSLGLRYLVPEPQPISAVVFAALLFAHVGVVLRGLRSSVMTGVRRAPILASLATVVVLGVNDSLVALGLLAAPYLMSAATVGFVIVAGLLLTTRFVRSAERAARLASDLGAEVDARTRELDRTLGELAAADRLAVLGGLAASLSHALEPLLGAIEGALRPPGPTAGATRSLARITRIVRALRQADAAVQRSLRARAPVALAELVRSELLQLHAKAASPLSTALELEPALDVEGDPDLLGPVVSSLLAEAAAHLEAAPGHPAVLHVRGRAAEAAITLELAGLPEAAEGELSACLEGRVRSRADALPLHVAAQLARMDGGEVTVGVAADRSVALRLTLRPARPEPAP